MREKRDGDDAIRKLDRMEYGYKRRPLRVEWAKVSTTSCLTNHSFRRTQCMLLLTLLFTNCCLYPDPVLDSA